jgi:TetR/AcrR family transcriptional regulator, cholesterol catabolism regulator
MEKKDFYVEKSLKLFLKHGIKSVTIGEIANRLNISTKTIYKLFIDKTGLVKECLALDNQIIHQTYEQILQKENALSALMQFYNELANRIASVNPNYFADLQRYFPEFWAEIADYSTNQLDILLRRGVESGIFFKNIDTLICAKSIGLLINAVLQDDYFSTQLKDRRKLTANVLYPYIRGICTHQGLEEIKYNFNKGEIVY